MRLKRFFSMLLICMSMISCLCGNAAAVDSANDLPVVQVSNFAITRASAEFSMTIPAKTAYAASNSFSLEAGETVTIKASYTPFSASVDFGLIAPDGLFYSVNVKSGSVDQTFDIDVRGNYTLAIRNNSSSNISVSGYVNY